MTTEQLVAALAITALAAAVALVTSWAGSFQRSAPTLPAHGEPACPEQSRREPSPSPACQRHIWLIATREETAGRPRAIFRCSECGALEVRELP